MSVGSSPVNEQIQKHINYKIMEALSTHDLIYCIVAIIAIIVAAIAVIMSICALVFTLYTVIKYG